ncbi:hypothetical protein L6452_34350 [Arctium lappa]|uniref:Uncharacterized protein n=1 Tax=Arctium lappa TaxID=4217 RepID=A0ACB8YI30_ARCLA|nr:hypothetical protein L6452_34350 [Arctium lappa]
MLEEFIHRELGIMFVLAEKFISVTDGISSARNLQWFVEYGHVVFNQFFTLVGVRLLVLFRGPHSLLRLVDKYSFENSAWSMLDEECIIIMIVIISTTISTSVKNFEFFIIFNFFFPIVDLIDDGSWYFFRYGRDNWCKLNIVRVFVLFLSHSHCVRRPIFSIRGLRGVHCLTLLPLRDGVSLNDLPLNCSFGLSPPLRNHHEGEVSFR